MWVRFAGRGAGYQQVFIEELELQIFIEKTSFGSLGGNSIRMKGAVSSVTYGHFVTLILKPLAMNRSFMTLSLLPKKVVSGI